MSGMYFEDHFGRAVANRPAQDSYQYGDLPRRQHSPSDTEHRKGDETQRSESPVSEVWTQECAHLYLRRFLLWLGVPLEGRRQVRIRISEGALTSAYDERAGK